MASASVSGVKPEMSANSAAPWTVAASRCPSRARAGGHRQCGRPRCRSGSFPSPLHPPNFALPRSCLSSHAGATATFDFIDCPTRRVRIGHGPRRSRPAPGFARPGRRPRKIAENMLLCIVAPHLGAMRSPTALPPSVAPSRCAARHRRYARGRRWCGQRRCGTARYANMTQLTLSGETRMTDTPREPRHARFGSGRAVRRVEDDALLTGRGRFADDFTLPGQTHLVFLRSPHAHARIASIDTQAAAAMPGVVAIVTGEDLVRAGVRPLPMSRDFKRPDGGRPPRRRSTCWRWAPSASSARRSPPSSRRRCTRRATPPRRSTCATTRCRRWPTSTTRSHRARRWSGPTRRATSPARRGTATPPRRPRRSRGRRTRCASTSSTSGWCRRRSSRATTLADFDAATGRITLRASCQTPTGLRDELAKDVLGIAPGADPRRRRRRRRRLRHEDDALPRGRARRVLRADAAAAGAMVRRAAGGVPVGLARPRRQRHDRARARRRRQGAGAAARVARQPRRLRDARRRRDPAADRAVGDDQRLRHSRDRPAPSRACSPTRRRPAPTAARGGPRRSTSSSARWTPPRASPASTRSSCAAAT